MIQDLFSRVEALEDGQDLPEDAPGTVAREPEPAPAQDGGTEDVEQDDSASPDVDGDVDKLLADWPPRGDRKREERRAVGRAALRWLRDEDGPRGRGDFEDALLPEYAVDGQSAETWWRKSVRPALKAVDAVEYHHGPHTYEWTDGESGD
ncbi:hypothetical protein DMJ13_27435 [halophilic archaeon]|nr:hypothetical protein DMJ13_27435 [halophilic archaeon]